MSWNHRVEGMFGWVRRSGVVLGLVGANACLAAGLPAEEHGREAAVEVALGGDALTSGIPGEGPLSMTDIQAWLADPKITRVCRSNCHWGWIGLPAIYKGSMATL